MLINTTPYEIRILDEKKQKIVDTIPRSDVTIKLEADSINYKTHIDGIPLYGFEGFKKLTITKDGNEVNIQDDGNIYIVPLYIKQFSRGNWYDHKFAVVDSDKDIVMSQSEQILYTTRLLI